MYRAHSSASLIAAAGILAAATLLQAAPATDAPAKDSSSAKQSQKAPAKSSESPNAKESRQAPAGFVFVEEQLVTLTANEPQNHFLRAKEYLARNDPRAAAAEVRISAVYLDMQAARKGDADQKDLRSASAQLRTVADQVAQGHMAATSGHETEKKSGDTAKHEGNAGSGQSTEQQRLDQVFARTEHALAKHFQEECKADLSGHKITMAGEDLDAATSALEGAIAWSGKACPAEGMKAISDARRVSAELLTPVAEAKTASGTSHRQADNEKATADNEAQPAAARLSARSESGATEAAVVPKDAEQVIDELGKSIEASCSAAAPEKSKEKSAETGQQSNSGSKNK